MSDKSPYGGKAVVDGVIRYVSASSIGTGDPHTYGGCERRYLYKYVLGIPDGPATKSQQTGTDMHNSIEAFYKSGGDVALLNPLAMSGRHLLPAPGPDLLIEFEISGNPPLSAPLLMPDGIPMVGKIDLMHRRGVCTGANDIGDIQDPPLTAEVRDWKSTSDLSYAKRADELSALIQMNAYGKLGLVYWPDLEHVRLSHGNFQTGRRAAARLSTTRCTRDAIERGWERTEGVVRSLRGIARETDPNRVDANPAACDAYKRRDGSGGCAYRSICPEHAAESVFDRLFGKSPTTDNNAGEPMSLLARINGTANAAAGINPDAKAKLEAEERAARAAAEAETARLEAVSKLPAGYGAALAGIIMSGRGFPTLVKNAAIDYKIFKNISPVDLSPVKGSGELQPLEIEGSADVIGLAAELAAVAPAAGVTVAQATPDAPSLLPPGAPASDPQKASAGAAEAKPTERGPETVAEPEPEAERRAEVMALDNIALGIEPNSVADEVASTPRRAAGPGRGKRKAAEPVAGAGPSATPRASDDGLLVFVDCVPAVASSPLAVYVDNVCHAVAENFEVYDIRCAKNEGKQAELAFGKWRGVLAAYVRRNPPPAGVYTITSAGEINESVIEGLAPYVAARGVR